MKKMITPNAEPSSRLAPRIEELRLSLVGSDPGLLAARTGCEYNGDKFHFCLWGKPVSLTYPGFHALDDITHLPLRPDQEMLLLYYFSTADGTPATGEWISFADLPDARFYNQAFQGYTGHALLKAFGPDRSAFEHAATRLHGQQYPCGTEHRLGDAAFVFQALPFVTLLVIFWQGESDDDSPQFPPSYQILFDSAASHYLPTDAYAILGSSLTRRLISRKNV